jgi:hypothetical protein
MRAFFRVTVENIEAEQATELLANIRELTKELPGVQVELNLIG